jgi:phage protein U
LGTVVLQGRAHAASRWTWPPAREAQALLRRQLMPQLTGAHADHELLQAQAEFRIGSEPAQKASLTLPAALRPLSVTTLRPRQQWVGEGEQPIALSF